MEYDFNTEKSFSYEDLTLKESIKHIAKFTSDIWQIHPFCEGNTRATAVFMIKYLKSFGFDVNNDVFKKYSWYFRNALVRANYNDWKNGVYSTTKYLEDFYSNLLMGTDYELKNRYMHLDYNKVDMIHSDGMVYMNQGYDIAYECSDEYEGAHLYKKQ